VRNRKEADVVYQKMKRPYVWLQRETRCCQSSKHGAGTQDMAPGTWWSTEWTPETFRMWWVPNTSAGNPATDPHAHGHIIQDERISSCHVL
jgi:hypothetical protein